MALLYEELGDGCNPFSSAPTLHASRQRLAPLPAAPPQPPARWVSKVVEEKRQMEANRPSAEGRWSSLKSFRRARGLCFTCGERWNKEHVCKPAISLHIVQEMIECMQSNCSLSDDETTPAPEPSPQQLMLLSAAALTPAVAAPRTMQLRVEIQGQLLLFLMDSGSSTCFIDHDKATLLVGRAPLPAPTRVQIAGGALLQSTEYFLELTWTVGDHSFTDCFRILSLNSYDGIIGHDWLAKHSPMITHWSQHWIAVEHSGELVVLHGEGAAGATHALLELLLV
jgi:hypothetical protein